MKSHKVTTVSTNEKTLLVTIEVVDNESDDIVSSVSVLLPFNLVPPQIAHQIASNLVMCNSYYVEKQVSDSAESK